MASRSIYTNFSYNLINNHFILTYSLDVDLKSVKSILSLCLNALLVKLNTLLLEEVLNGRLSGCAVVGCTIVFDSSTHVVNIVMSAENLILW